MSSVAGELQRDTTSRPQTATDATGATFRRAARRHDSLKIH
jgi:hypothetical protein